MTLGLVLGTALGLVLGWSSRSVRRRPKSRRRVVADHRGGRHAGRMTLRRLTGCSSSSAMPRRSTARARRTRARAHRPREAGRRRRGEVAAQHAPRSTSCCCSPARRTRQTWEGGQAAGCPPGRSTTGPRCTTPGPTGCCTSYEGRPRSAVLLLVGHAPGVPLLVEESRGARGGGTAARRPPTSSLAVLRYRRALGRPRLRRGRPGAVPCRPGRTEASAG